MITIQEDLMKNIINDYNNGLSPNRISENYPDFSPYIIRENLKRLGVFKTYYFTCEELESIKKDFINGFTLKELVKKYNRPEETIRKKLQSFGIYSTREQLPYTDEEIFILKQYYPLGDWDNLFKLLPNRNRTSILTKASKLGISQENWYVDKNYVIEKINSQGFGLLTEFTTTRDKHKLIDNNGYLYYSNLTGFLYDNGLPLTFSQDNIYTINNIKTYIKINNIDCKLLSLEYKKSSDKLLWKCSCGNDFLCSWADFYNGKHCCNMCSDKKVQEAKSYSIYEVKEMIKNKPYKMIEGTFTRLSKGFAAITDDGYYVIISRDNIYNNNMPEVFHKNNPYTIKNINTYIKSKNISSHLVSTKYISNEDYLEWQCACSEKFKRSWNSFYNGATDCPNCANTKRGIESRVPINEIVKLVESSGYFLAECINDSVTSNTKFTIYDDKGYFYETNWNYIRSKKTPIQFHKSNKYTIQNINKYLDLNRNGEYVCISDNYLNNTTEMKFKHIPCGWDFNATLVEMQGKLTLNKKDKYYKQCPKCNTNKTESNHASTLKQVFLREYPDTTLEDKSCINPKTNRPLPTDIVNHRLEIAIEIQSSYHDTEHRKKVDSFKKNFWINKGYSFYDPDIRDYSILEMIQIFFPNITEIPKYIDYNFSDCMDFTKVQDMLDNGYTISEISGKLGIKRATIQGSINSKKVNLPDGYKDKVFNITPIIRLSKDGVFLDRFNSLHEANKKGFKSGTISRVLKGKRDFSYDSFWVYEKDYMKNNYKIPELKFDKFTLAVNKYDMNNLFVCSYNSIYEAEENSESNRSEIYRVATGDRKSCKKEKWKFKKVA